MTCGTCESEVDANVEACPNCGAALAAQGSDDEVPPGTGLLPWGFVPSTDAVASTAPARRVHSEPGFAPSPGAWHPVGEVGRPALAAEPVIPVRLPRRKRWPVWSAAVLLLLLAGTGLAGASAYYGWFPGRQAAEVLPGNAVAYAQLDLNPSWEQKLAAAQFLRGLPQTSGDHANEDVKATAWGFLASASPDLAKVDFATRVRPWLGDRIGLAVVPNRGRAALVVAVEVTDEPRARAGLLALLKDSDVTPDITMRAGFALLTDPDDTAAVLRGYGEGALASRPGFAGDLAAAGNRGVVTLWADAALSRLIPQTGPATRANTMQGSATGVLKFTADTFELSGQARGQEPTRQWTTRQSPVLGDLPADTGAALNVQGGGALLAENWAALSDELKGADVGLPGVKLPDDLIAVLGRSLTVAAASDAVRQFQTFDREPDVGVVIASDQALRAQQVLRGLPHSLGAPSAPTPNLHRDGDLVTLATTQRYLLAIGDRSGPRLSGVAKFAKAVPAPADAVLAGYVDLQAWMFTGQDSLPPEYRTFAAALRSAGFTLSPTKPGEWNLSVRVVRS